MKLFNSIIIYCLIIVLTNNSCTTTKQFFASFNPPPSFHQKNEIQINSCVGKLEPLLFLYPFNTNSSFPFNFDNYLGYSVSNYLFFDLKTSYSNISNYKSGSYNLTYFNGGIGVGYYKWVKRINFGARIGFQFGKTDIKFLNNYFSDTYFNANNYYFSFTPYLGYEYEWSQIYIQFNIKRVDFYDIKNKLDKLPYINDNTNEFNNFKSAFSNKFMEPSLTLKSGNKYIKFVYQTIFTYHFGNKYLDYLRNNSYIGIEINLNLIEMYNKLKK